MTAASVLNHLDASALPPTAHNVHSGFDMLGKTPSSGVQPMKKLTRTM